LRQRRKVVDLGRERRTRAALKRLRTLLDANDPALMERTSKALTGRLAAPGLEKSMANDEQIVLRLPSAMLNRAEKLEQRIASDPAMMAEGNVRMSRSVVLRMALARGLETLEKEYSGSSLKKK